LRSRPPTRIPHTSARTSVFKTTDAGRTWKPISGDLTRNEKIHQQVSGGQISLDVSGAEAYDTLLVITPSAADPQIVWAGSDDGLVHVTRDGGASWHDVTPPGLPRYARVESVDAAPADAGSVVIALDRHDLGDRSPYLFATHDGGRTWRRIDAGLPRDASTHVVRMDPKDARTLYAGTERGVYYSMSGGTTWLPLQFNLPPSPVYDLQIQPRANDLIVATHGRSFWILDDLTPIQEAGRAGRTPMLFPIRPGTQWAQYTPIEAGDGGALYNGGFVGPNPKGPALITFFQRAPAKRRPELDIVDAAGRVVRHLRGSYETDDGKKYWVSNATGYNRLAWDGTEDGPVRWHGTTLQNMGPLTGAEALPGAYTVRLRIDGALFEQPFVLAADPRSPWTAEQRTARHAFLQQLNADFSEIDVLLNAIDVKEKKLRHGPRTRQSLRRLQELAAVRDALTANDRNDEDSIARPDRLREQIGAAGLGALQPPFAAHLATLHDLQADFDRRVPALRAIVLR
jgi:hypothetical protein